MPALGRAGPRPKVAGRAELRGTAHLRRCAGGRIGPLPDCARALASAMLAGHEYQPDIDDSRLGRRSLTSLARANGVSLIVRARALPRLLAAAAARDPRRSPPIRRRPRSPSPKCSSRDVTEWDEFTGRLEAVNTVAVRPRVSGFVSAVRFTEGAVVHRGDLLFQIDPRPFQAEVDRLRAELARARATVRSAPTPSCSAPSASRRERDVARGVAIAARLRRGSQRPRSPPSTPRSRAAELTSSSPA